LDLQLMSAFNGTHQPKSICMVMVSTPNHIQLLYLAKLQTYINQQIISIVKKGSWCPFSFYCDG
jgi:hypothetical protein